MILTVPDGFTLTGIAEGADYDEYGVGLWEANEDTGKLSVTTSDNYNDTVVPAGKELVVFTLDASSAAEGNYVFTFKVTAAADIDGNNLSWRGSTVTSDSITVAWHTVTWMNGTIAIETDTHVPHGDQPSYDGSVPTKDATAQYTYGFLGWNTDPDETTTLPSLSDVTSDVTYYAVFGSTVNEYTITWKNDDGTVIDTTTVAYGSTPTHADAEKEATAQYTYTFEGWDPEITSVTGDAAYTAQFSSTVNEYTITWNDDEGNLIDTTTVEYGVVPTHADPSKPATAEYTYTFAGWTPEVVAVTGAATYKATYTATKNSYTITWNDDEGNLIDTTTVEYGVVPTHADPSKAATAEYTYTFAGWTPEVVAVTGDAAYTATFSSTVNEYTVTFNVDGVETEQTYAYGSTVTEPAAPTKANYVFDNWYLGDTVYNFSTPVTGDITLTAHWVEAVAKIGDDMYSTLQGAIEAAHDMTGNVTVEILKDITEVAVIHQKAGLNLTVDGAGKKLTGQIIIDGDGRASGTETLTIKNVKFEGSKADFYTGTDAFILVPSTKTEGTAYYTGKYNYAHNITVSDCSFTSTSDEYDVVGIKSNSGAGAYNVTLNSIEMSGGHSFAQFTALTGLTITDCEITGTKNGINISGGGGIGVISGTTITANADEGYTVRLKDASSMAVTLSGNVFSGGEGIISAATSGKITVLDGKYAGPLPTDGDKLTIEGGVFTVIPVAAVCGEGKYPIANTDEETKDDYPYTVGGAVALVNGLGYQSFDDAAAARTSNDDVITLLADITETYTMTAGETLKVEKNGKSFTPVVEGNYVVTSSTVDGVTTYTVEVAVAKIGDDMYSTLQKAIDAAHDMTGSVTVELLSDITEVAVIHQKAGLDLTVDGKGKTITGQLYVDGDGRYDGTDTLTITNVKFAYDPATYDNAFVYVPSTKDTGKSYSTGKYNYAHNVTVSDCEFAGEGTVTVAVRTASNAGVNGLTLDGLKVEGGHSFAQLTGTTGSAFTDCEVTGSKSFVNISGGGGDHAITG
ncbi:MAG: InlB B-repeat-containing protein, partial [Clostridia bacterium]|nr:InlB B-repeat-containing protein [Clostridia bacterium]